MKRPGPDETLMLYGHKRVRRSHRRIMIVLLAADGLTALDIMQLAQAGPEAVTVCMVRLQVLGWVEMIKPVRPDGDRRIRYQLTGDGGAFLRRLLGLDVDPWPRLANKGALDGRSD